MATSRKIYINGTLFDTADAKVSVLDHGLLYGDGVFEGLRIYSGNVFHLKKHVVRLFESAKAILLEVPMSQQEMCEAINATVEANGLTEGYVRVVLTRGVGTLGLDADKCSNPQVIIIADLIALYPPEIYEKGLEIITVSVMRNHPAALSPRIKSLNYLNNILAKIEGMQAGCIEALMLNHKGEIAECTGDNIFLVKNGRLFTPPLDAGILAGITRDTVIEIAEQEGMEVDCIALTKYDVYTADECFLTGTAAEVVSVVSVDARVIGTGKPGPVTLRLKEKYEAVVSGS